jgi:hypothetical protein
MSMLPFRCACILLAGLMGGALSAAASAAAAAAQIYVMESTVAAIRVGSALDMGATISIPAGGHIRAVLPSGKTQTIRGPYDGTVENLASGQPINASVMSWIANVLRTGGATESTPGATRSITRPAEKPRAAFSWTAIPVASGTVCVEQGRKLTLVRIASPNAERAIMIDGGNQQQAELAWEAGSDTTPWPANLTPRNDVTYDVLAPGHPRHQITLRVLERLPAEDSLLVELNQRGCSAQFEAWVRGKLLAGK